MAEDQLKKYFDDSEIPFTPEPMGRFIRYATAEDINEEKHFNKIAKEEMQFCRKIVKEMNLPMKIVDAEHLFGGERIIFYFMSEGTSGFSRPRKKNRAGISDENRNAADRLTRRSQAAR